MSITLDWHNVLTGMPRQWLISGYLTTLWVTALGIVLAGALTAVLLVVRYTAGRAGRYIVAMWISLFRNTPILVQLLFWYFAVWGTLPTILRDYINDDHSWSVLPGNVWLLTPEFLCAMWGLGVFTSAFLIEEVVSGLRAIPSGQDEAARSQGFSGKKSLWYILLPQGLANARQPIIGQLLNLMKLSSLASAIGFAELTYQVRQIESYNGHALEAYIVGTALYLVTGVILSLLLGYLQPSANRHAKWGQSRLNTREKR